ncbi:MAG: rRNA maturation RNase YbeY [candidate division WOR-3 bacterium]
MEALVFGTKSPRLIRDIKRIAANVGIRFRLNRTKVNVIFVDNRQIQELNRRFLKRNRPTDVLAFPLNHSCPESGMVLLGEVYVSREQARLQARENGVRYSQELRMLVLHGLLHLAGLGHREMKSFIAD